MSESKMIDLYRLMVMRLVLDLYDVLSKLEAEIDETSTELTDDGFDALDVVSRFIFGQSVHEFYYENCGDEEVDNSDATVNPYSNPFDFTKLSEMLSKIGNIKKEDK